MLIHGRKMFGKFLITEIFFFKKHNKFIKKRIPSIFVLFFPEKSLKFIKIKN